MNKTAKEGKLILQNKTTKTKQNELNFNYLKTKTKNINQDYNAFAMFHIMT